MPATIFNVANKVCGAGKLILEKNVRVFIKKAFKKDENFLFNGLIKGFLKLTFI